MFTEESVVDLLVYYNEEDNLVAELSYYYGIEPVSETIINFN